MSRLIYASIPAFLVLMVLEGLWARRAVREGRGIRGYEARDTAASLAMGVGNVLLSVLTKFGVVALWAYLWEFRVYTFPEEAWWSWVALFFAEDFCYYWFHRAHHEVRFFWAAHVNHHSSTHYNLSTALRQSWTTPLTGPLFWLPLPLLGFSPAMILTQQAISLLYQFWLHTEAIGKMGPFEWVFNTPSHHRVHHGRNVAYLDRNHGGILILWDRLFGTFAEEKEQVDYGLTKNLETFHPVRIAFHEWSAIGRDVLRSRSLRDALGYVFGPPGWSPDGSTLTSRQMRQATSRFP
jgi:sterol desaturase/sphingolipid hydroxylase (fatty acid hydroxylase superfamily)